MSICKTCLWKRDSSPLPKALKERNIIQLLGCRKAMFVVEHMQGMVIQMDANSPCTQRVLFMSGKRDQVVARLLRLSDSEERDSIFVLCYQSLPQKCCCVTKKTYDGYKDLSFTTAKELLIHEIVNHAYRFFKGRKVLRRGSDYPTPFLVEEF